MSEIIKKKLVIEGEKVHDVGYRLFLMDLADDFLLPCFSAKNKVKEGRQQVVALVGGEERKVETFIASAKKEFPPNAKVGNVCVSGYEGDIRTIESFSRSFSTSQLSKIANAGVFMLGKQDQTVSIIREGNEKVPKEIRTGNEKVTGKLDRIHTDLSVNLKGFHKDTIARFDVVDDKSWNMCDVDGFQAFSSSISFRCDEKYGKISENIGKAIYAINRTCDNTEKLLEKSERDRKDYRKSLDDLVGAIVKLAEKK
ncbi:MAG: acylphosphatase [Candidatus Aenigmarchaeota archaeon]|nr:acylphosphatase [Candidatus Aenigmarchaeota archaeon]